MKITIRGNERYKDVKITEGSTTIDMGLLDEKEARALANDFQEAIDALLEGYESRSVATRL